MVPNKDPLTPGAPAARAVEESGSIHPFEQLVKTCPLNSNSHLRNRAHYHHSHDLMGSPCHREIALGLSRFYAKLTEAP